MLGPGQRGVKRKLDEGEDEEDGPAARDRESVFTISLCKLNRYRQIPDPSLRRSVLICNTLRNIERELERKGLQCGCVTATAGFLPALQIDSNMTLDPLPNQGVHTASPFSTVVVGGSLPVVGSLQNQQSIDLNSESNDAFPPSLSYEKSLCGQLNASGRATPFLSLNSPDPCRTDSGALWSDSSDDERSSSISWSTVLNLSSQSETDFISSVPTTNGNSLDMSCSSSSDSSCSSISSCNSSSSSNSSTSSSSEIFGDIDLSLYDFDLLPLSPPNVRLTPLSAEELVRSFPNNETLPAGVSGNGCFKNEFLSDELDHIMHILVGM